MYMENILKFKFKYRAEIWQSYKVIWSLRYKRFLITFETCEERGEFFLQILKLRI